MTQAGSVSQNSPDLEGPQQPRDTALGQPQPVYVWCLHQCGERSYTDKPSLFRSICSSSSGGLPLLFFSFCVLEASLVPPPACPWVSQGSIVHCGYPDTSQLSPLSWGTLGTRSQICSPTHPHLLVYQQLQSPCFLFFFFF